MKKKQLMITAALLGVSMLTLPSMKANAATTYPGTGYAAAGDESTSELTGRVVSIERTSETEGYVTIIADDGYTYVTKTPIDVTAVPDGFFKISSVEISGEITFRFTWGKWEIKITVSRK